MYNCVGFSQIQSKNTELVSVSIGIMGFVVLLIALEHSNMCIDFAHNILGGVYCFKLSNIAIFMFVLHIVYYLKE